MSTSEWINKIQPIQIMDYYLAIKNEFSTDTRQAMDRP